MADATHTLHASRGHNVGLFLEGIFRSRCSDVRGGFGMTETWRSVSILRPIVEPPRKGQLTRSSGHPFPFSHDNSSFLTSSSEGVSFCGEVPLYLACKGFMWICLDLQNTAIFTIRPAYNSTPEDRTPPLSLYTMSDLEGGQI